MWWTENHASIARRCQARDMPGKIAGESGIVCNMHETYAHITPAELAEVERPIARARGMPNATYTDARFHDFERDHIFANTWSALAFCDDHARPGAVAPLSFMGLPLLVARRKDGTLAVFHNVCSHRGMRLVEKPLQTNGLLVCPYHAWSYDLCGNLRATPDIGGVGENNVQGFCREQHGLKEIRSHCWMGILFINISGDAPAFAEYAAPLIARYRKFLGGDGDSLLAPPAKDSGLTLTANCNWKLAVENYCEAYHLPQIHPSLNSYSPLARHYCMTIGDDFAGQGTDTFAPTFDGGDALPLFPKWPAEKHAVAEYPTFYPNLLLGYQVNHVFAMIIHPLSHANVREEVKLFYVGGGASDERHRRARQNNLQAWQKIFREDIGAVEGMQRGRSSPGFRGGVFSPKLDAPTHHFHRWLARKYRAALGHENGGGDGDNRQENNGG